jgi:hypothetical protein
LPAKSPLRLLTVEGKKWHPPDLPLTTIDDLY